MVRPSTSTGAVRGDEEAGGLVGSNRGVVTDCYSTGAVYSNGDDQIGGLVGSSRDAVVMFSFWDIVTSGRAWSDGGIGLTTAQMWEAHTFLDAGWDFVGETANGTEDIWRMQEQDYPQLAWEPLVKAAFEGFESGQFSAMGWRHAGDLPWQVTSAQRHSGQYSARSGAISHGQTSTLRITCPCSAGTFSFLFKTSTESGDKLTFKVDGQQKAAWSGSSNWKKAMLVVAAGMHTFEWSYVKDASVSAGQDTVWIDEVVFP